MRRAFFIIFTVILIGSGIGLYFFLQEPSYITHTVQRGDLLKTVDSTGDLVSELNADLSFNFSGTVENIYFALGDEVKKGDLLAELDADLLTSEYARAERQVAIAQANLDQLRAGISTEKLAIVETDVQIAEQRLENAKTELASAQIATREAVDDAKLLLDFANKDLEQLKITHEQDRDEIVIGMVQAIEELSSVNRQVVSEADEVLGVENDLNNNDFENVLGSGDRDSYNRALRAFANAQNSRNYLEQIVEPLNFYSTWEDVENVFDPLFGAVDDTNDLLFLTRKTLDGTKLDTIDFSLSDLQTLKASIDSARTLYLTEVDQLLGLWTDFKEFDDKVNIELEDAVQAVDLAEQDFQSATSNRQTEISRLTGIVAERELEVLRASQQLAENETSPRVVDEAPLVREIERARSDLSVASARLEQSRIYAPISGTLTQLYIEPGEQVTSSQIVMRIQTTNDSYYLLADVPESDVSQIVKGQFVQVEFDAFGPGRLFKGEVLSVRPGEKIIEGVVYFEVEILIDAPQDINFKPGLSADAVVTIYEKKDVIYIPRRYILRDNGMQYVRLLENGKEVQRYLTLGMLGDSGFIEVVEGLIEGEQIIIGEE